MRDAADVFDGWALAGRDAGMERGHGETAGPLLAALPVGPGTRFLDLGCGNGWACRHAAARGARAVGVDASGAMLDRARAAAGPDARFHQADFAALPLPDSSVDVAWSMEALYYARDPEAVLREVLRVLAPGGELHMVIDHYAENPACRNWQEEVGTPMVLWSQAEWEAAFRRVGFQHVRSGRLHARDPKAEVWKREAGSLHVAGRRGPPRGRTGPSET